MEASRVAHVHMDTNAATTKTADETPEQRERLLSALKPYDRDLIEWCLENYPGLSVTKAIEICDFFGGLSLSGTGLRGR
jgi:hypothetical protein